MRVSLCNIKTSKIFIYIKEKNYERKIRRAVYPLEDKGR